MRPTKTNKVPSTVAHVSSDKRNVDSGYSRGRLTTRRMSWEWITSSHTLPFAFRADAGTGRDSQASRPSRVSACSRATNLAVTFSIEGAVSRNPSRCVWYAKCKTTSPTDHP
jgi:hypothetical protein